MTVDGGPNLVTDSLVLHLDAANTESYSGSGTVWTDLAQGLEFNAQGTTQTPHTEKGGVYAMQFNNSGWWNCGTGYDQVDLGGDCTLIFWIYPETITERDSILDKKGTSYNSYQQELAVTWEVSNYFSYYSRYSPAYDTASGQSFNSDLNSWVMTSIKLSTGRTATARTGFRSRNGSAWTSSYNSNSNTALISAEDIRLGNGYAGVMEAGALGALIIYEKMLSDDEILQNYDVMKGRFGL